MSTGPAFGVPHTGEYEVKVDHVAATEWAKVFVAIKDKDATPRAANLAAAYLERERQLKDAMILLDAAKCPQCDGSGSWADPGDGSQIQCQWCFEHQALRAVIGEE